MAFNVLKRDAGLIGIDFGFSSVKVLGLSNDDSPVIARMGQIEFPDTIRDDVNERLAYAREHLSSLISRLRLTGARAACSIPASRTVIQHLQVPRCEDSQFEQNFREQFAATAGCDLNSIVLRHIVIDGEHRRSQSQCEVIGIAVSRDLVMKLVELAKACRLRPVAMHAEPLAVLRAFDHITQHRTDDELTTVYLDIGAGATKVLIAHGRSPVFAKAIPVAGRQFDQRACEQVGGDLTLARKHRLASSTFMRTDGVGQPQATHDGRDSAAVAARRQALHARADAAPSNTVSRELTAAVAERCAGNLPPEMRSPDIRHAPQADLADPLAVDLTELLDTLTDDISMCLRYHQSKYPERRIDRAIFLGGESVCADLCQYVAKRLRLRAHLGDPLARLSRHPNMKGEGIPPAQAYPGWAVPLGLCVSPTDL